MIFEGPIKVIQTDIEEKAMHCRELKGRGGEWIKLFLEN